MNEKLKSLQLDILRKFIKICSDNSLRYFALGGTVLGAIRHKGFIPWDDDIDVALPRKDYEIFLKIAQSQLPQKMFLQTFETDLYYPNCFAKIRISNTTFIEKTVSEIDMNHGVYMDIFPLDGYPKQKLKMKLFRIKEHIFKISQSTAFLVTPSLKPGLFKRYIKNAFKVFPYTKAVKKLDKLYKKNPYDSSEIVANFGGAWGIKEVMPKEIFGKGIIAEFEGIEIIVPEKTSEYLTRLYGDYMTPPPPEKRIAHHYCTVIDLEKSYKNYIK